MADTKISDLTAGTAIAGTEVIPGVQSAATVKFTFAQTLTYVGSNLALTGPITSSGLTTSVAAQTGTGSKFVMDTSPTLVTPIIGVATGTSLITTGVLTAGAASTIGWTGKSLIQSPTDGNIELTNNAVSSFGLLQFGGTTSSFPAIKRTGTVVEARLADDSAYTAINALTFAAQGGGGLSSASTGFFTWTNRVVLRSPADGEISLRNNAETAAVSLSVPANNFLQIGPVDAASPAAQTIRAQNVATGTSNTAGADLTIQASKGTGTGTGGNIIFQVSTAGSTGTSQNASATALTIAQDKTVTTTSGIFSGGAVGVAAASALNWGAGRAQFFSPADGSVNITNAANSTVQSLTIPASNTVQLGLADAAAPVAQTLQVQSVVTGTTNTSGTNLTINGSKGTGTGTGGNIVFQVSTAGSTGSTPNALASALTVQSNKNVLVAGLVQIGGTTSSFPAIKANSNQLEFRLADDSAQTTVQASRFTAAFNGNFNFNTRSVLQSAADGNIQITNSGGTAIASLTVPVTNTLQFGLADAAAPAAQTLQVQNVVTGTANTAGVLTTLALSKSTGTGLGGGLAVTGTLAGSSGSTVNTATTWFSIVSGAPKLPAYTVATLPAAATIGQGGMAFVTDANATMTAGIGTTAVGGGANKVKVYSDGTNWIIG